MSMRRAYENSLISAMEVSPPRLSSSPRKNNTSDHGHNSYIHGGLILFQILVQAPKMRLLNLAWGYLLRKKSSLVKNNFKIIPVKECVVGLLWIKLPMCENVFNFIFVILI